ncbi:MAG: glycoside hydrolase family 15 protein [Acidimicrobiales bacterium]
MTAPGTFDGLPSSSPFPPIADYAFLSDCESMALVAPSGNVEWLCLPRVDSPSVFGSILDRHAGGFRLGPVDRVVPADRRYLPGTMVLETSWGTPSGWVIVRDALLIGPWHHDRDLSHTHRRAPTDYDADHVLLRTVRCANGEVQIELECEPMYDYGRVPARWAHTQYGYNQGIAHPAQGEIGPDLVLTTDMRVGFEGGKAVARTLLKEGETRFCALSWTEHEPPFTHDEAYRRLVWTAHHWQHWLARGNFPDHRWRTYLERSALTLKGLTFAPTGALVAAPTTSLPETPKGERNWDYRYSWIRDSAFTLWGLHSLGFDWEANDYFWFLADLVERDGDDTQIVYGVGGERELQEIELDHLSGYDGARPVRIGNAAYRQSQHDVFGAALDSIYIHTRSADRLDDRIWPVLRGHVEAALGRWREPDRGIWEMRGESRHFTSSKVMCWVAADRATKLARIRGADDLATRWRQAADEIHADVCEKGVNADGVFTQSYGSDVLDASVLLIPLLGFLPAHDPRVRATVLAVADELTEDGLVLRYRVKEADDGLPGEEGTFTICSFWLVSALSMIGEKTRARELCERLLSFASPLLLYAEELDARSGRHYGNFPQAFTHLALINAVLHVIADETDHEFRAMIGDEAV